MIAEADKTRVAAAIAAAERTTSGEIFCVIAQRSGDYWPALLVCAVVVALISPLPLLLATTWSPAMIHAGQLVVFLMIVAAGAHPRLRLALTPKALRHRRAHELAQRQFLAQGLPYTEARTGVLIFASAAERYAEIVADRGIDSKVSQQVWDQAIAALIGAIKDGRPADGFVAAIEMCGKVLAEHFPPGALDRNELPDKLIEI